MLGDEKRVTIVVFQLTPTGNCSKLLTSIKTRTSRENIVCTALLRAVGGVPKSRCFFLRSLVIKVLKVIGACVLRIFFSGLTNGTGRNIS